MKQHLHIVVAADTKQHHQMLLQEAAPEASFTFKRAQEVEKEDMEEADIIIGNPDPALFVYCKKLKWLQLQSAGTNGYSDGTTLSKDVLLSNGSGVYGLAISEFMLTTTLMMYKKMPAYAQNQMDHVWKKEGEIKSIYGSTVLILGLGDIGSNFGKRIRQLGGYVIAVQLFEAEANECADEIHAMKDLDALLPKADLVAIALPGNDETYQLFDKTKFALMKPSAHFMNIGRGFIVKTEDLLTALKEHTIAGAALDVIDPEPLPKDHEAWTCENLMITPHVAGGTYLPETNNRYFAFAAENVKRYLANQPIRNQVDPITGCRVESVTK